MLKQTLSELKKAVLTIIILTVLLGVLYPLTVWGLAQLLFPARANGSFVYVDNKAIGSKLIAQRFTGAGFFHPRPADYSAPVSGGSNLGPLSKTLIAQIKQREKEYREENQLAPGVRVPVDAVMTSGSGLDPHISIENASLQAVRVAKARNIDLEKITAVIDQCRENRQFGILGEKRVNVFLLNLEIEKLN